MKKHNIRLIVDIAMTVLLPMLMAYSLIGEMLHETIGTAIFVLFIVHHILNRKWYGALFKGRYNAGRIFRTVLDILLLVIMILQPISGILMSKHLYAFLPVLPISALVRSIHMMLAYWGYCLMSVHAGTHLTAPMHRLFAKSKKAFTAVCAALVVTSLYGIWAFGKRGFPGYMSGKAAFAFFDYSEPRVFFFLDYLAIMVLFMIIGSLIACGIGKVFTKITATKL